MVDAFDDLDNLEPFKRIGGDGAFALERGDHIFKDVVVVGSTTFVRPIVVRRIGRCKRRHHIVLHMTIFDLLHVLSADFDGPFFGHDRDATFKVFVPNRRRIVHHADSTLNQAERHES